MPNRTIYVKDENLWEKAKELAGKGGLSEVISNALQKYVAEKEAQAKGLETFRIIVHPEYDGPVERIAFRGRKLAETNGDVTATVWETERGRFVLTLETDSRPSSEPCFYYVVCKNLKDLAEDEQLQGAVPHAEEWLIEVELIHAKMSAAEIWIDDVSFE